MLVPAIERDREHGAGLPLEGDAVAGIVPHCGRAAAVERENHLLIELALRLEPAAGCDLADIAVVRGARGLMIDEYTAPAAPHPRLQFDRAQVRHVMRADNVEAFALHPAEVGRVLFGRELVREFIRRDGVLGHAMLLLAPSPACGGGKRSTSAARTRPLR